MKETVAVATVDGKSYFLIVNELRQRGIPFVSMVPGQTIPAKFRAIITTEKEKLLVKNDNILIFHGENELDGLVNDLKRVLEGKEAYERIVIGIDPGGAIGLAVIADGKVIEESNCLSPHEVVMCITKIIRNVNLTLTTVIVKVGNGVPIYEDILEALDEGLPFKVTLEVVGEAGTNRPLKENKRSRKIRHISSAIHIAGRSGDIMPRKPAIAD